MTTYPETVLRGMKRWTVTEYHELRDRGILADGAPIELIDGFLMYKDRGESGVRSMSHGPRHAYSVEQLASLDHLLLNSGHYMRTQLPVVLADIQEPEPDGCVVRGRRSDFRERLPRSSDLVLVIEVADTSLEDDRERKLRIYATAAILTYWIVNLRHNTVEVYEQPDPQSGEYRIRRDLVPGESATIALPGGQTVLVPVRDLVG
jgi:Uma2 family endonuclease